MTAVITKPNTQQKLELLSADAQYDLACACSCNQNERRTRGTDGKWIYPVTLPNGGTSVLFKTLLSNVCINDCKYCPLRAQQDARRCTLAAEETVGVFLDYLHQRKVFGLFLSSGVVGGPDATMERLNRVARLLRYKHKFRGYIHLKVIPGASDGAIEEAVSLASTVSLNIETAGEKNLAKLSSGKDYLRDIIEPIKLISRLTARGNRYERVKQTTQFIIGAADEKDRDIVRYMWGLYDRLRMHRVYFSAYQRGLGDGSIPGENRHISSEDMFMREHRLYQVDFLMRKYGFTDSEIVFDDDSNLSLSVDPKQAWAKNHPEYFPVSVNRAAPYQLLRVPGLGPVTVDRILDQRRNARLNRIEDIGHMGARLAKAAAYLTF